MTPASPQLACPWLIVLAALGSHSWSPCSSHIRAARAIVAYFYAVLASSWALLAGYAGQFSFAQPGVHGARRIYGCLTGRYLGGSRRFSGSGRCHGGRPGWPRIGALVCGSGRLTCIVTIAFSEILRVVLRASLISPEGRRVAVAPFWRTLSRVPYTTPCWPSW